ncbi:MAG: hypothetical protein FIA99_12700 [Ruminiclostridium sp.]|nr:hypothetical protein [Ruminiclostridium sp.]
MKKASMRKIKRKKHEINKSLKGLEALSHRKKKKQARISSGISINSGNLIITRLLKYLYEKEFYKQGDVFLDGTAYIKIPEVFSLSENPDKTIDTLKQIYYYGTIKNVKKIFFDHSECNTLGIGASTIMDIIVMEMNNSRKMLHKEFELEGKLPPEGNVRDFIRTSGILKHLGFAESIKNNIRKLELIISGESDFVSTEIVDYILQCLSTQKLTLKKEGKQKLSEMLGEIIDNCKAHGGDLKKWYTLGHYNLHRNGKYGECHLVIFNFGQTIYESLNSADTTRSTIKSLRSITKKHITLFRQNEWTVENLWTLYALQDGVSRFRNKKDPDRGTGTIKLIDGLQSIGKNKDGGHPIMTITSGHTQIYFDGTYNLKEELIGNERRQIIAFNEDNDLKKPPDKKYVRMLNNYFPGTIISMKFYIDGEYIKQKMEERKNGN